MKTIFIFLLSCTTAISVLAQTVSTVTINIRGNNNEAIVIDNKEYVVYNDYSTNTNTPIVVSNLQSGQHTLQIKRSDEVNPSSTVFTTRTGYDLQIIITANGSVQLRETKWKPDNNNNTGLNVVAMSDADFNNLYSSIRNQWRSANRMTMVSDAFANTTYYFTTTQAKQLIQLINNQSNRFTLAKASYRSITDPTNFTQLYDLLNSQAYRDQLADYVSNYNAGSSSTAMTSARFNTIYRTAQRQATLNSKVSYIYNAFTNTNNYFTVAQAKQLVQLAPDEANRLYLAKISYRSIIDRMNFSQMNTLLNNQSSRNELTTFVSTYNDSNPVYTKVAMKDVDFNTLYRDIQNRYGVGAKISALTNVFATGNYYFTTAQVKQLIQLVSAESNRLDLAKASYDNIIDQANFSQLYDIFSSSSRNELEAYIRNSQTNPVYTPPVYTKVAMKEVDFNALYLDIQNRYGLGAKMSALANVFATENYYFTTAQVKQLIQLVSSESNRLDLAKASYDNIVDQANFSQLYDIFSSSSRNELEVYVRNNQTNPVYTPPVYTKTPMSNSSFTTLYNDVRSTFGLGAKMSRLTDIFENETNYFTVAQAKQLIQLVSAESNRLELAKSAYGNVTDPENFNLMYDLLTSQASKNELSTYVNTYSYNRQ